MKLLEGKVVIVKVASRVIAIVFAQNGANVASTYSTFEESALALENELNALGIKSKAYKSSVADFNEVQK
jgi:3-oxoacyl-[acyl-carrier protein] reductase